ncbi:MAG TPA: hypothetical protein VGD81_09140 [Opitutaceae bacterium]
MLAANWLARSEEIARGRFGAAGWVSGVVAAGWFSARAGFSAGDDAAGAGSCADKPAQVTRPRKRKRGVVIEAVRLSQRGKVQGTKQPPEGAFGTIFIRQLHGPLADFQGPLSGVQNALSGVRTPLSQLQSALSALQAPLSSVQSPLSGPQSPLPTLRSRLSALQGPLAIVQSPLSTVQSALVGLQSRLSTMQSALVGLQSRLSTLQSVLSGVQSPLSLVQSARLTRVTEKRAKMAVATALKGGRRRRHQLR